jgi:xylulokinase
MTRSGETLLGIDAGTTGCKVALFSPEGRMIQAAYREYDIQRPQPGWAELDTLAVWNLVKGAIREVTTRPAAGSIRAVAVSSMGEAMVPVTLDRAVLGPSLLNFDTRGEEYLDDLRRALDDDHLYRINGNTLGNHYSLTKLKWIKQHQPDQYDWAAKYLHWSGFIAFMLGADPVVDYSLANRTLLFDLDQGTWSAELVQQAGLDMDKLPRAVRSGTPVGTVSPSMAAELGLPAHTVIVAGAHDQCANAVGCGVIEPGSAVYGMGTYVCITPVFTARSATGAMIERGLNTEHHAVPDRFVSFIYNHGGSMVKWFRDTFASADHAQATAAGQDVYPALFAEIPDDPSRVIVLPHFAATGPPEFISDSCGVMAGIQLATPRGEILKGIIEGVNYYLKACVDTLPATGITITDYRTVGGGSKSDVWVQTCADIMGRPFSRPTITEAGAVGAAIMAGVGSGEFSSFREGVEAMIKLDRCFDPDPVRHQRYAERYELYKPLWPLMREYLQQLATANRCEPDLR